MGNKKSDNPSYPLYAHQSAIVDQAPNRWLLAWEVGTGKSLAAIKLAEKNSKYGASVLIVCPKSIVDKWYKEIAKFRDDNKSLLWNVMSKETFKREAVGMLKNGAFRGGTIIVDEAHYFSGMRGYKQKSHMLTSMINFVRLNVPKNIYLLTGTPYMSTPWNIFALAAILGRNWDYMKFKNYFFHMVNMGGRFPVPVIKKGIEAQIANQVAKLGNTIKLQDCADIPEQTYIVETFDLTTSQKNAIEALDDTVPISRWTHTHSICGGTLKGDGYTKTKHFKSEKLDRLLDLRNEHKKLVVVCRYNAEIDYIASKLENKNVYILNGKTKKREKLIEEADNAAEAIILINSELCEGFELPSFHMMLFYSYSFSLKSYIQMKGRILRINKLAKKVYLSLIIEDSIDYDVYDLIVNKKMDFQLAIYKEK